LAFPEFDYKIHVYDPAKLFPRGIPSHWRRWRSVDNGYDDPYAWYWFAVDEFGTVYVYREFTRDREDKATKYTYSTQAEKVAEKSRYVDENGVEHEERFQFTVAGHDAWATHVRDEQGKTLVDYYNDGGVFGIVKAITDRKLRKATIHEYLAPYMDENIGIITAKVQISKDCKKLIENLDEVIKDPKDPEKYDEDGEWSHCLDGFGYGLVAYHASKSNGLKREKTDVEKYREKIWRNMKRRNY
jgi:hypothetical protein